MRLFALSLFCDKNMKGKEPEEIGEAIGIGAKAYKQFLKWDPYFSEWLEESRLALGGKSRKQMLDMVGMEKAMSGEFNFWKAMAIKEGVIAADTINVGLNIPSNLDNFKDMTDEQLAGAENSIMAALRGQADPGTIDLFEGADGWEREGDTPGADPVPASPVVLADELGADGEHAIPGLEPF